MTKIALADDHALLRNGLANLLRESGYEILFQCNNGEELVETISAVNLPDIILMDINMPVMNGYLATQWLKENFSSVKVLALSMYDDEHAIIRMLRAGAKGYILKDCDPSELRTAIHALETKGFYHSELVSGKLIHTINFLDQPEQNSVADVFRLNARETEFMKWLCTELTYKEIADKMHLSPRTIDGYRDGLFEKLGVKSRTGLVLFAIKNGIAFVN